MLFILLWLNIPKINKENNQISIAVQHENPRMISKSYYQEGPELEIKY